MLAVYFGILTLSQGVQHAIDQSAKLWYWLVALAAGFGFQAGLFDFVKRSLKKQRSATASVATSGGVSVGSMAACCAHHLADVLPLLGLSGLTAFLVSYQLFFIIIGVAANLIGITMMLDTIQRHGLCPALARLHVDMGLIKKGTIASAIVILAVIAVTLYA